jgi:hypothetical protein
LYNTPRLVGKKRYKPISFGRKNMIKTKRKDENMKEKGRKRKYEEKMESKGVKCMQLNAE